jgi:SAM-dependent methyltransferase/spore maturation protein CgeB
MEQNEDRILDAYYGRFGTKEAQERLRERIHWITSQVEGPRVLDMGCSQGLVSILLGREGHQVLGVDIRPDAIEFANKQLEQEPPNVRQLVSFQASDAAGIKTPKDGFDTIVLGEILEHQSQPERLLEAAHKLLRPGGKAIITVPFGVHPDPDHKQTFYVLDLVEVVSTRFAVQDILVQNKYIYCTAAKTKKQPAKTSIDHQKLLKTSENAFLWSEQEYRRNLEEIREQYKYTKNLSESNQKKHEAHAKLFSAIRERLASWRTMLSPSHPVREMISKEKSKVLKKWLSDGALDQPEETSLPQLVNLLISSLIQLMEKLSGAHESSLKKAEELKKVETRLTRELAAAKGQVDQISGELRQLRAEAGKLQKSREKKIELEQQLEHKNWLIHQKDHSIKEKKETIRHLEKQLKNQIKKYEEASARHRTAMKKKTSEIRYKLGDALVSSVYRPESIPGLPMVFARLFMEGLKKARERKNKRGKNLLPPGTPAKKTPAPQEPQAEEKPAEASAAHSLIYRYEHPKLALPVACILDEFSMENFRHECNLLPISYNNWKTELEQLRPAFLLVESAWFGNQGSWQYKITYSKPRPDNLLFELLKYCGEKKIPTVFWNKEDPPNYGHFIDAARRFDYIFTSDANCVEKYKKDAPDSKIFTLPFAAQTAIHNPVNIQKFEKLGDICFAGAWYPRHPERFEDARMLLEASQDYEVHIYDRYLNHPQHEKYKFPEKYQWMIRGSLSYEEMLEKYRQYKIFLNVNSVKDSPTMFSRRVLEILACGTPVVSGYAKGIEAMLGTDAVPMCTSTQEAKKVIDRMMNDPFYCDVVVMKGQRKIFSEHTYTSRIRQICETLGIELKEEQDFVSVITATIRKDYVDNFLKNFKRQTFKNKELLVVINAEKELTQEYIHQRAKAIGVDEYRILVAGKDTTLGSCLNLAIEQAKGNLFAKMDDDDYYGEHYLEDSVLALRYSGADCVGKESHFTYSEELDQLFLRTPDRQHKMTQFIIGTTIVARKSIYPEVSFGDTRVGEDTIFLNKLLKAGMKLYSHSQYNYIKFFARSLDHHTWKVERDEYLKDSSFVCSRFKREACCF